MINSSDCDQNKKYLRVHNYEFSEAVHSYELAQTITATEIAKEVSWYMNVTAMLNSCCIGGAVTHIESDSPFEYSIFLNLFSRFKEKEVQDFLEGMLFYHLVRRPGFSNGTVLLKQIMPASSKPCIFSYKYLENNTLLSDVESNEYPKPLIDIDVVEHYGFTEVQTIINPMIKQAIRLLFDQEPLNRRKMVFRESLRRRTEYLNINQDDKSAFSFKLFDKVDSENLGIFSESTFELVKKDIRVGNSRIDIQKTIDFAQKKTEQIRGEVSLVEALNKSISEEYIISTIALGLLDFHTLIYFPATYYLDNKAQANDAVLKCYMSEIDNQTIKHEYNKLNELYTKINWSNTRAKGDKDVSSDFGHEIRHQALFARKANQFLENNNVDKTSSVCIRLLRDNALSYIDLWASSNKQDGESDFSIELDDITIQAIYIGFIRRFYDTELNLFVKHIDLLKNLLTNRRISVILDLSEDLIVKEKYKIALTKALMASISNSVYHILPSRTNAFEELIKENNTYKILLTYNKNIDSNISQINVYNSVSIPSLNKLKQSPNKEVGTLKVIKSQVKILGGNAFMELVESEADLPIFDQRKISYNEIIMPIYRTCMQF